MHADIIADICLGQAPSYNGVITMWFPPAERASAWFLQRPSALSALALGALLPLMAMRDMQRLSGVNLLGIGSLVLLCGGLVVLAAAALAKGVAHPLPMGPDLDALGRTTPARLLGLANVLPVIITAAAVHQSVHPLRCVRRTALRRAAPGERTHCSHLPQGRGGVCTTTPACTLRTCAAS